MVKKEWTVIKALLVPMVLSVRVARVAAQESEVLLAQPLSALPCTRQLSQRIPQYSCGLFLST